MSQARNTDAAGRNNELIINCLPLNETERSAFIDAADGRRQEFVTPESERSSVIWQASIPQKLRAEATVVIGNPPADELRQCPSLRWLQTSSAGVDAYVRPGVLRDGVMVTGSSGAYGPTVSEHMYAMMWALMKNLHLYRDLQRGHVWRDAGEVLSPARSTVLIIGTGDIGSHFAELVKSTGAMTLGVRRTASKPADGIDRMYGFDQLDELLPQADVVAMVVPSTQETHHLIDARRLRLMKSNAVLLNAGRGDAIDCIALAEALTRGTIRAAGLDVTEPEPLPSSHPLWDVAQCLITPHVAGGTHLGETADGIVSIALENLRDYVAARPLHNSMR